jgi:hypothetical protein
MTHATPNDIHDHAYGFRTSPHISGCDVCRREAEHIAAERSAIQDALAEEAVSPPEALLQAAPSVRRYKLSIAGLAAAAVLLATLAWLLFHAPKKEENHFADSGRRPSQEPVERLISELQSSSSVRREIATLALKRYGSAVVEKLEKAKVDPTVIDACRGITAEMKAIQKKLDTMKIDLAFENTSFVDILAFIRDFSGLNIVVDAAITFDSTKSLTLKTKDLALKNVLSLLLTQFELTYAVTQEKVVLITSKEKAQRPQESQTPIRIPGAKRELTREIAALGSEQPAERDRASAALRAIGFAAEHPLWDALGSGNAEIRARAADLLRTLYSPEAKAELTPVEQKLRSIRITIDMENAPLTAIVKYIGEIGKLTFVVDPVAIPNPDADVISFKVQDIVLDGALKLMLGPREMGYVAVGDVVLVTKWEKVLVSPTPPFWTTPAEAREVEALLADVSSGDPERQKRGEDGLLLKGPDALGPLTEAAKSLSGEGAGRCRALRLKLAEAVGAWLVDEPSGVDLQTLTKAQQDLLTKSRQLPATDQSLREALQSIGVQASFKAGDSLHLKGCLQSASLGSLLKALLRPGGLDFYLDGETIVVDTAANVRAALEKRP